MTNLNEIKERCEKATPGPWSDGFAHWGRCFPYAMHGDGTVTVNGAPATPLFDKNSCSPEDGRFIAHSRTDVPALCKEVEAWREIGLLVLGAEIAGRTDDLSDDVRSTIVEAARRVQALTEGEGR